MKNRVKKALLLSVLSHLRKDWLNTDKDERGCIESAIDELLHLYKVKF